MSEDDDIPSPTESDPVSDVNPHEMAQLMADLDDMDNELFKSGSKGYASKNVSPDAKKANKKVSFQRDLNSNKNEDDWDSADDLLNSDDEKSPKQKGREKPSKVSPSATHDKNVPELSPRKISPSKSLLKASPKPDKSKLLSDLFDDSKSGDKNNESTNKISVNKTNKSKSDVNFDDDTDPLNMDIKPKPLDSYYLDDLLGKRSITKTEKKVSKEFVLPDRYKPSDNNKILGMSSSSPKKKNGRAESSNPLDNLFSDTDSRPRRRTSAQKSNKSLEIDDDDILGGVKHKQKKASQDAGTSKQKEERKPSKQDDWLFGSPKGTPLKMREEMENNSVSATVEVGSSVPSVSPKKDDWLNHLLTSNKSSPSIQTTETFQPNASAPRSPKVEASSTNDHLVIRSDPAMQVATINTCTLSANPVSAVQSQIAEQQAKMQTEAAAMTTRLQIQQQEAEAQLLHQFQVQMQEQQQRMAQMMMQQKQMPLPSYPITSNQSLVEDDESVKQLKVNLHKAETVVGRLEAELSLLKEQHEKELEIITVSHKKKEILEEEVWMRKETSVIQERDSLIESHKMKITEMQKEIVSLTASHEAKVSAVKAEMGDALQRSKEMYANIIDRMKKEHHNAVDRLMELKDIELKAVLSATGRVKEVEYVLGQLEANTTDISQITNAVNKKHDSALELVKKSLEFKEKQLKDMETNLGTVRAESESERNRLTILVNRLESSLSNQGTEIESQKWLMAQEKMKLDVERTSLMEEKRHFQLTMENERRELARSKESIMREQKEMMQTIAKQKSHIYDIQSRKPKNFVTPSAEMEVFQLREERRILEEKIFSLRTEQEEIIEEERIFEEKRLKLEEEYSKNATMKEVIEQKSLDLEVKSRDLERKEEKLEESRKTLQKKLSEITQATQNLHLQQDALSKERARLELEEEDAFKRMNKGLCLSCSSKLRTNASVLYLPFGRIPGDGSEMHIGKPFDETRSKKSFDPASVLSRLKVAREEENKLRERKHQLQASSGLKPS